MIAEPLTGVTRCYASPDASTGPACRGAATSCSSPRTSAAPRSSGSPSAGRERSRCSSNAWLAATNSCANSSRAAGASPRVTEWRYAPSALRSAPRWRVVRPPRVLRGLTSQRASTFASSRARSRAGLEGPWSPWWSRSRHDGDVAPCFSATPRCTHPWGRNGARRSVAMSAAPAPAWSHGASRRMGELQFGLHSADISLGQQQELPGVR
jgi:hypothetical protein